MMDSSVRQKTRELLTSIIGDYPTQVNNIEKSCFNSVIDSCIENGIVPNWANGSFTHRYSSTCHKIIANIDPDSSIGNSNLLDSIRNGAIDVKQIGYMSSFQLCPDSSEKERNEIDIRSKQKIVEKVSTLYSCPKCKSNNTTYREVQSRCLDEAADIKVKCSSCKFEWVNR